MKKRDAPSSVLYGSERRRSDDDVAHLIDRIRTLVTEQRRLDASPKSERREGSSREIEHLQERLANAVKRELRRGERSLPAALTEETRDVRPVHCARQAC